MLLTMEKNNIFYQKMDNLSKKYNDILVIICNELIMIYPVLAQAQLKKDGVSGLAPVYVSLHVIYPKTQTK